MLGLVEYVGFVTAIMLAFGLAFEFPVVLFLLARVGILQLRASCRAAALGDPAHRAVRDHRHARRRHRHQLGRPVVVMYGLFEVTLQLIRPWADAVRCRASGS